MSIEDQVIDSIKHGLTHFHETPKAKKFACPYCQVDRTSKAKDQIPKSKCKGYFYKRGVCTKFKCHKCGTHKEFHEYLSDHAPSHYLSYICKRDELGIANHQHNCPTVEEAFNSYKHMRAKTERGQSQSKQGESPESRSPNSTNITERVSKCTANSKVAVIKLPSMRSPQQQAGDQSRINQRMSKKHGKCHYWGTK